ncbi:MAG: YCF48-related protein [bacterium]|nr:YCF48-related protein [bacterium]
MKKFCLIVLGLIMFAKMSHAVNSWTVQYSGTVYDISFPDSLHGWAAGGINNDHDGRVLFTNDGGKNWTEKIIGDVSDAITDLTCICFADSLKGWIGGSSSAGISIGSNWFTASTTNGFNTWTYEARGDVSYYRSGDVIEMTLVSGKVFWSVHWNNSGDEFAEVYGNGAHYSCSFGQTPQSMCFTDYLHGWIIFPYTGGSINGFHRTVSGVKNFSLLYSMSGINGITFIDRLHGWAVGYSGKILYTDNGGADSVWDTLTSGVTNNLKCVKFVDSLNGWVGGEGIILRTRDGGKIWEVEATVSGVIRKIFAIDTIYAWSLNKTSKGNSILKYKPLIGIEDPSILDRGLKNVDLKIIKDKIYLEVPNNHYTSTLLTIYDLTGRLKETLYSGTLTKGDYTFTPNITKSGIYFVRLTAVCRSDTERSEGEESNIITETKKLILIK